MNPDREWLHQHPGVTTWVALSYSALHVKTAITITRDDGATFTLAAEGESYDEAWRLLRQMFERLTTT